MQALLLGAGRVSGDRLLGIFLHGQLPEPLTQQSQCAPHPRVTCQASGMLLHRAFYFVGYCPNDTGQREDTSRLRGRGVGLELPGESIGLDDDAWPV